MLKLQEWLEDENQTTSYVIGKFSDSSGYFCIHHILSLLLNVPNAYFW